MSMLGVALDPARVIVAVDPGKVMNRVWVSNGAGLLEAPVSLPVSRAGVAGLEGLLAAHPSVVGPPVIAIEATGLICPIEELHCLRVRSPCSAAGLGAIPATPGLLLVHDMQRDTHGHRGPCAVGHGSPSRLSPSQAASPSR